jgi:hypothetical protein
MVLVKRVWTVFAVFWIGLCAVQGIARADVVADLKARAAAVVYADGMLKFHGAIEHLGQGLYRHGMEPPDSSGMAGLLPFFRMNLPANPAPEKLDYQGFRAILARYVEDMDAAEAALAAAGDVDVKVPVDLSQMGFDFNADGKRDANESLAALLTGLLPTPAEGQTQPPSFDVNFDTADIYWMRGYGRLTSAFAQFLLAHDFQAMFDKTFHRVFQRAGLPVGDALARADVRGPGVLTGSPNGDTLFADLIAMFHLINWQTVEPARLADVRVRLKAMAQLSPKSWAAARAETDNDREWMPNPKQTQAITGSVNTDAQIDGWLQVMQEFEAVLDGKKLMPHWRFDKGMNVKRFFETSQRFDFVLMVLGVDAVQYVEDGEVSGSTRWNDLMRVFDGNFLGFALWYN